MMRLQGTRPGSAAISSIYGAFAVVLVAALVVGVVLHASGPGRARSSGDGRLADLFLDTLLKSTVANRTSLQAALAGACLAAHCPLDAWNASELGAATDRLASPLAGALERHFSFTVAEGGLTVFRVGDLSQGAPGTASRADVFHTRDGKFLEVTAVLSAG